MASKTIMIQEETYNQLKGLKNRNESFNDVINRLLSKEQDLFPFFGLFTEDEGNLIETQIDLAQKINDAADKLRGDSF